ncbi:hypothetical protein [Streptomyces sp. PAN_FS17]|uniref:hypothetical protein n=1 Tax=Streptomyces sp. PAN_FS17 TaxID=1855351 RepID=UPI00089C82DF|nr:hypothetical protein [Streptomyces sp. PAN_FS17]SEE09995.1 hypothetical protein SAMN05216482_9188 [Streptomyces sp. PAN_FS17]
MAAAGADGTRCDAEEPLDSEGEASADAVAFLGQHCEADGYDHTAAHAGCFQLHRSVDGYVGWRPLGRRRLRPLLVALLVAH